MSSWAISQQKAGASCPLILRQVHKAKEKKDFTSELQSLWSMMRHKLDKRPNGRSLAAGTRTPDY
eukprot:3944253-Amphidinium_carterae.1